MTQTEREVLRSPLSRPTVVRRLVVTAVIVLAAALALLQGGCVTEPERPNLLLISVDSLRADHADGVSGTLPNGPRLRALAQQSVVFTHAIAAAPWTTPSMMTVLTGLLPWSHHVRDHNFALSTDVPLLSERLQARGYRTAAIVPSATLREEFGFARGFDFYSNGRYGHDVTTSPAMTGQALAWLEQNSAGPFFLWIHFWDPHYNYLPPPPYDRSFESAWRPPEGTRYDMTELKNHESPLRPEECDYLKTQYDGELLYTDRYIGDLLDFLTANGLDDNTIVVLLGDHGEAFQEHGWLTHTMRVHEEMVRVPLVLRWPGRLSAGERIDDPVSLVDVTPTILDLLGLETAADGVHGAKRMEGRSLAPGIRVASEAGRVATGGQGPEPGAHPIISETIRQAGLGAIRNGDWKYILNFDTCAGELFDLAADPGETVDLSGLEADRVARLRGDILRYYREGSLSSLVPVVRIQQEEAENLALLRALGYVQTDAFGDVVTYPGKTDPAECR